MVGTYVNKVWEGGLKVQEVMGQREDLLLVTECELHQGCLRYGEGSQSPCCQRKESPSGSRRGRLTQGPRVCGFGGWGADALHPPWIGLCWKTPSLPPPGIVPELSPHLTTWVTPQAQPALNSLFFLPTSQDLIRSPHKCLSYLPLSPLLIIPWTTILCQNSKSLTLLHIKVRCTHCRKMVTYRKVER